MIRFNGKSIRDATEATRQRFDKPRTTTIVNYLVISAVGRRQCVYKTTCRPTLRYHENSLSLVKYGGALVTGLRAAQGTVFCVCLCHVLGESSIRSGRSVSVSSSYDCRP